MAPVRKCEVCRRPFEAKRPTKRFCSDACRQRARKATPPANVFPIGSATGETSSSSSDVDVQGVAAATRAELERLSGALDSMLGRTALALAARIDGALTDSGQATASLAKELRVTMEAVEGKFGKPDGKVHSLRLRLVERAAGDA